MSRPRRSVTPAEALGNLAQLAEDVNSLSRAPFKKMLGLVLGVNPTKAALQRFANKSPDRWAQALSVLGVLAGYERGADLTLNFYNVKGLSDAELLKEAAQRGVRIIDGEAVRIQESAADGDKREVHGELTPTNSGPTVAAEAAIGSMPKELGTTEDNA